ncbi:MAG: GerMN domain-containing protein [bacterium]|nr:GerMN domain-containing protein [bacterium]
MLKRKAFNRILLTTIIFFIVLILCTFMNGSFDEDSFREKSQDNYVYTLNSDNYVSKASVYVSKELSLEDEIKEKLEIITDENNKNSLLPSYFKPILPKNTEILDVKLEDSLVKLYFSKELYDINKEQAEKMIESIIYTINDNKDILGIEIYADGDMLKYVPHTDKMLPTVLTRDFGINKTYEISSTSDIVKVVMTYYGSYDGVYYEVPITKYVNSDMDRLDVIINNLDGMVYGLNLISMVDDVELVDYKVNSGCIYVVLNRELDKDEKKVVRSSIFANYDVKDVEFGVRTG